MQRPSLYLSLAAGCIGFAAMQMVPSPWAAAGHGESAQEAKPTQVSGFADRAHIEQTLAQSRPPVPLQRESKLTPYVPADAVEPSTVAIVVLPPVPPTAPAPSAKARSEDNGYRSARTTAEARWRAVAVNGSTAMAVTATP